MANDTIDFQEEASPSGDIDFQEESSAPVRPPPPSTFDRALRFLRPGIVPPAGLAIGATLQPRDVTRVERRIVEPVQKGIAASADVAHEAFAPAISQRLREMGIDPSSTPESLINVPTITAEMIPSMPGLPPPEVSAGVANLTVNTLKSLAQPENAVLLFATAGEGNLARAASIGFATEQFAQLPEQAQNAMRVLADPKATKAQKVEAIGQPLVSGALVGLMAKHGLLPTPEKAARVAREIRRPAPLPPVEPQAVAGGTPIAQPGRRMVVAPPGMATLEQAQAFSEAGRPIRRPIEEVRVPPEAPEGQPTYQPSGLGRPTTETRPEVTSAGTLQPPAPPIAPEYVSGRAAQTIRERGEAQQRAADFEKAVAEKVSQQQAEPLHPEKPLTANQLRIVKDSLIQAVTDNTIPGTKKGLIVGSDLERWADGIIKTAGQRTRFGGIDPELAAAGVVKGAAFIERGVTAFAEWSTEMLREFGDRIKPHLQALFDQAKEFRAKPIGPEIAKMGPVEAGGNDMLGNPLGTQYYATPEDWTAWQQIQADKAAARAAGQPAAMALAFAKNEVLKNKYGGSVPLAPKTGAEPMVTLYHGEGGQGGAGTDTRFFTRDPIQAATFGENITQVDVPESVAKAAEAARQAQGIGTPGGILPQEWVKQAKPMARPPSAPVTEIPETPIESPTKPETPISEFPSETTGGPVLVTANRRGSIIRLEFDASKGQITADQIEQMLSDPRWSVSVTAFAPNEFSVARGRANFRVDVGTPEGPYSSKLAKEVYLKALGTTEDIYGKSALEAQGTFQERFKQAINAFRPKPESSSSAEASTKGLIAGSDIEKWADNVIKKSGQRLRSGLDPELAAAGVVKGAAILERGITEFAKWSAEMVKAFGEAIRPHLTILFEQAKDARSQVFRRSSAEPAARAVTPPATEGSQPPPSPPEVPPVQPEAAAAPGEPVHGIAARVSEAAAKAGIIAPVEPGEGIAAAESVAHGRDLLAKGANPQTVLDEFNRTKAVTADGMAVVRAQGERLRKAAYAAADRFGTKSAQYEAAWKADSDWTAAIKPMQTEWHKIGQAQQGEVAIDTDTFHGLRSAFFEVTGGKDFTPDQKTAAERIAKESKQTLDEENQAKDTAFKKIAEAVPKSPTEPTPKPRKGTAPVAKPLSQRVWQRAKQIIDSGKTDFDDLRHKLAIEFGVPVEQITRIITEPKTIRAVTDEMYSKMSERRRVVQQAKNWLKDQQIPGWRRFIRNVPRVFFIDKVFGHGTVGMITHAGLNIFNPAAWSTYWPNFLRQYKLLVSPAYHERMMQDLVRDPLFTRARRAGLANDPFRYQDDYQTPGMAKWLGRLGLAGNRGFDSLKLFRQARFNQIWNDLPPNLKTPQYAQLLADSVNHSTGVVKSRLPGGEWANWTFFAPKLEGSRWAWMVVDPIKAAGTFLDWGGATPEARAAALAQLKEKATIAGMYYGLLALNQGILSASGSKDKVNFTNPRRSDFLSFKAEGHNIGIVSPMLGMVRLFANMLHASTGKRGKVESLQSRADEMGATVAQYARGKLSPFAGFGVDLAAQSDFQGRPLPYSNDPVPKYLREQGIKKYTYGEYAAQEFTPIPVSEAVREVWRAQGMNEDEMTRYLDALLVGVVAGGTGARITVESPKRK